MKQISSTTRYLASRAVLFAMATGWSVSFISSAAMGQQVQDEPRPAARPKTDLIDDTDRPPMPRDLGPPLVANAKDLQQLGKYRAWLDPKGKQVVLVGEVCKADYPLEFLITDRSRGYESVVVIDGRRTSEKALSIYMEVHKALLLLGATAGTTARYSERKKAMVPATGEELAILFRWKNKEGKIEQSAAQDWIRDMKTKKALDKNWVFAGSGFGDDGEGHKFYKADGGDFVCVLNSPAAMIDLPVESASAIEDRLFEAFKEHLPAPGTPVTILIKPVPKKK